jgi:hypothetical protein
LEKQFTTHGLCDENQKRLVEARVQALLETEDNNPPPPERIRPRDLQKLVNFVKIRKACGIDGILNECLRHLPKKPLPSDLSLSDALGGCKNNNLTEIR